MTKTEALLINRLTGADYGGKHVPERIYLLNKREVAAGKSLVKAGVALFREAAPEGEQGDRYPSVSMPWITRALGHARRAGRV